MSIATLKDIADLAGVSRGTVDRVLNNRGIVKAETAERIKKIADSLNYKPNKAAKALAIRKRNIKLGFIMLSGKSFNQFFQEIEIGIQQKISEFKEFGISVIIEYVNLNNIAQQLEVMDRLKAKDVSGLALMPINAREVIQKVNDFVESDLPIVTVNTDIENSKRLAYVGSNYEQGGKTAASLMNIITSGRANIGIIVGSRDVMCHAERVDSFCQYVEANYVDMKIIDIVETFDDDFKSFSAVQSLLSCHPEINALFIASAGVYGACQAVQNMGLSKQIKIISFDCTSAIRQLINDGIITATLDQQPVIQGAKSLDILFDYIVNGTPPKSEKNFVNVEIKIKENLSS